MNLDNNLIWSITSINGSEPRPWKILRSIKIFKVILNRWVENFVVLYNLDVFLKSRCVVNVRPGTWVWSAVTWGT